MPDWRYESDLRALASDIEPDENSLDALERAVLRRAKPGHSGQRRWARLGPALAVTGMAAAGMAAWILVSAHGHSFVLPLEANGEQEPYPGVHLTWQGKGTASGDADGITLRWEQGEIRVEVDPARGQLLRLLTPEAQIEVLGTIFTVVRDAEGTAVAVERGQVAFTCHHPAAPRLAAGEEAFCHRSAAAALHRVRRQLTGEHDGHSVFTLIEQGLALAEPGSATACELEVLRIQVLAREADPLPAWRAAERYLASGVPHRRSAVFALAEAVVPRLAPPADDEARQRLEVLAGVAAEREVEP